MLCKTFSAESSYSLGQEINSWLTGNKINILHLKYSSITGGYNNSTKCFSCLIIYELKYPVIINEIEDFMNWIDEEQIPRENGVWIKYFDGKDNHLTTNELFKQFKKK